ncbi:MAG: regulatory protein RecX [Arenimonas sp.]|nr:regulatory protein RecX [Arenimonas sp.]MBP7917499.1 regulatory protein RecX [Arenimonas sp.]
MRKKTSDLTAYQQALGLLVRREHSRRELKQKLKFRGKEPEEIDVALETLSRQDFQNDERFAFALARSRQSAGYGPQRIRAEMQQHSLDSELIDQAVCALECDWLEMAHGLVERRYLRKIQQDPNQTRKAVDFLLRRGFDQKTAYSAVKIRECPESQELFA